MQITAKTHTQLNQLLGAENVLTDEASILVHAYDCSLSRARPEMVLVITQREQIAPAVRLLAQQQIPFVARACATNHAGSCAPLKGGVVLNVARLNRILQINTQQRFAWVEPGVITAQLQAALEPLGFFYAPDPASERICSLGGNLAQNASGARCIKYGGTLDHVLAVEFVLPTGETCCLSRQEIGPDLIGLLTGSEGTLGVLTKIKVKILPQPPCIQTFLVTFPSLEDCVQSVTDLTAQGIIPRCVEAMDQFTLQAVEEFSHAGYPTQAAALLILELDGTQTQIEQDRAALEKLCMANHALLFTSAETSQQRAQLWRGRKAAYATLARLAPNVMVGDGTVPRSELPRALHKIRQYIQENHLQAGLLFHAGDGNFHPHLIFDEHNKPETKKIRLALQRILQTCVDCGGTISGEHGIGVEKRALMAYQYDTATLDLFTKIKQATDPKNLANPLKIIPLDYHEKARVPAPPPAEIWQQLQPLLETNTPFTIVGRNSRLKTKKNVLVSSKSLNRILDIDLQNYTVTAQAGVTLQALQTALAAHRVYSILPADSGTLGGAFSSGQFPDFYAQVTGLAAVLPDGSFIRYGGKLTKNAAGYNLIRLFAGAQGHFGLVTELTFKIYAAAQTPAAAHPFQTAVLNAWARQLARAIDPKQLLCQEPV